MTALTHLGLSSNQLNGTIPNFIRDMKKLKHLNIASNSFNGVLPFNSTFIERLDVFKVGENSNLCYNHMVLRSKLKLGIAVCDKHGLPLAKDSLADDPSDGDYDDDDDDDEDENVGEKKRSNRPNKVVLGFAIEISSIVFLIVFLVLLAKCCK